jgi:Fic family protein
VEIQALIKRIDETKKWISSKRPLAPKEVKELDAYFRIGTTFTSNALEGNTLTLTETKILLEDGLTAGGKPLRDSYEALGHAEAYDFMLEAARSDPFVFSELMITNLHKLFFQKIDNKVAGAYRDAQVFITGTEYIPPPAGEVPVLMKELSSDLEQKWNSEHPVNLAAYAHQRLVDIHPFEDGNGRTARLLMNLILINKGYQIVSIPPIFRQEYINAINKGRRGGSKIGGALAKFIAECEIEAQKDFCRMFHIKPPKKEDVER